MKIGILDEKERVYRFSVIFTLLVLCNALLMQLAKTLENHSMAPFATGKALFCWAAVLIISPESLLLNLYNFLAH